MTIRDCSTLAILAVLLGNGNLSSADNPLDRAEPAAKARFEEVTAAYKALSSYQDQGTFSRTVKLGGREKVSSTPLTTKFARPNRIAIDAGEVRVVSDGKTITTVLVPTGRYLTAPASSKVNPTTIADGPAGAILLGGPAGPPSQVLLKLLVGGDAAAALPDRATALKTEPDAQLDGKSWPSLRIELGDEPPLRLILDPETHLIRRMDYIMTPKSAGDRLPGSAGEISELAIAWNSGEILTMEAPAEAFAFTAPVGFIRIKAAEPARAAAEAAKSPLIGNPAPDFTLNIVEGPGKTKPVSREDLAGKVVVLDFWATWCGPCMLELPEIQKLAETLAKAKKDGVVIVAVSQDRAPEDGSPVRALVEKTLSAKSIEISKPPISRIALDPDQLIGDAFKVQALPTLVILDAKGVVQSVHVGFSDDIKDILSTEIDALLDGKSLLQPPAEKPNKR